MVEEVLPSLVNVRVKLGGGGGLLDDLIGGGGEGQGSGVVIDPKGIILTNNHVVQDAESVEIVLTDERKFPGRVLGTAPRATWQSSASTRQGSTRSKSARRPTSASATTRSRSATRSGSARR